MGVIQKVCHLHNVIFHLIQPSHTLSILLYHFSVLFTKLHLETIEWEKRRFFAYMAASAHHVISKEVENHILRHNWIFRHTCMYEQPALTN